LTNNLEFDYRPRHYVDFISTFNVVNLDFVPVRARFVFQWCGHSLISATFLCLALRRPRSQFSLSALLSAQWQSVGCVSKFDYYTKFLTVTIVPIGVRVYFCLISTRFLDNLCLSRLADALIASYIPALHAAAAASCGCLLKLLLAAWLRERSLTAVYSAVSRLQIMAMLFLFFLLPSYIKDR
jgi:hypothetical protein